MGDEDFAKSFMTSEYLFELFKNKINIDYTWVICGYVKSVEQLLYKFMKLQLDINNNNKLWIKANSGISKIANNKDNEDVRINPNNKKNKVHQVKFEKNMKSTLIFL